ncbi:1,4-alpha-glucan branching enzyme [Bacillus sp. OV194]|nr:1,4-alpha-glucan branching enzyme [Bacillus sp. OV194]
MKSGYFTFILHAHLPYVKHREANRLEERWVFEAMTETYIPLLWVLERQPEGFTWSISFSPPVMEMLADPVLQRRYLEYLDSTENLIKKEKLRTLDQEEAKAIQFYSERYKNIRDTFFKWNQNLLNGFKHYHSAGAVECFTTAATHTFLPYVQTHEALHAQIDMGIETFKHHFGEKPRGFWLPECAYTPGIDQLLHQKGILYTFVDEQTLLNSSPKSARGIGSPVYSPHGVALFPRNREISGKVWSSVDGYPGDVDYREFYRDIAYNRELDYILPHIHPEGIRIDTGLKYHRITGPVEDKQIYVREWAEGKVRQHAEHFTETIETRLREKEDECFPPHLITAPFDAELFGHWWFEGTDWISAFQQASAGRVEWITPSEFISRHYRDLETVHASFSTWGRNEYGEVWLNEKNAWMYRHLHKCEREIISAVALHSPLTPVTKRYVQQLIREWMLAASSDWAFIIDNETSAQYANERFKTHIERFHTIKELLQQTPNNTASIEAFEKDFPFLKSIDTSYFETPHDLYIQQHYNQKPEQEKRKILMLSWEFPPMVVGGLARHVFDLAKTLVKQGHEVHVVTCHVDGYPDYEINQGIYVYRVRSNQPQTEEFFHWTGSLNLAIADQGRELSKKIDFDCIHAHDWLVSVAAKGLKQELNIPLIATIHATEHGRNNGIHNALQYEINQKEWELCYEASQVIVCSPYMKKEVAAVFRLPEEKIHILPNGVDPELIQTEEVLDGFRFKEHHEILVFSVGRVVKEKGFQTIIEAAHLVKQRMGNIKFMIAGKGPMLDEYRDRIHREGLEDYVTFTGFVSDDDRNRILSECDIALFPSLYEPFGIVALEGMVAGKATVVSDTGGLRDIIRHEETGLKIYPGNPESLAWAVLTLAQDEHLRRTLAINGKREAETVFNWKEIAQQTSALYEQCLEKNPV